MELMTCSEFAGAYNISLSKVRSMCQTGELPALKIGVGWRINREKAEAILSDLFDEKVAPKPSKPRKTQSLKVAPKRKFDFLAEINRARGKSV